MSDEMGRIKKDLEKHGFPLEIRIFHILQNNGWNVTSKYSFFDEEASKTREVDCVAVKGILYDQKVGLNEVRAFMENNLNSLRIIIECKKSSKPWVFYTTCYDNLSVLFTQYLGDHPVKFSGTEKDKRSNQEFVRNAHQYSIKTKIAKNYFEPFTKGEGRQILDASMKVVKALSYDKKKIKSLADELKLSGFSISYYPVIVFEGNLYECTVEKDCERFTPTKYLLLDCNYLGETYRIDVVSSDFFVEFLKYLELELEYKKKLYEETVKR
jgi:hypothetical protein